MYCYAPGHYIHIVNIPLTMLFCEHSSDPDFFMIIDFLWTHMSFWAEVHNAQ